MTQKFLKAMVAMVLGAGMLAGCAEESSQEPEELASSVISPEPESAPTSSSQEPSKVEPSPVSTEVAPAQLAEITTSVEGRERTYLRSTPVGFSPDESWSVILVFHGWEMSAEQMRQSTELDQSRSIVVYPQGVDNAWAPAPYAATSGEEDLAFVKTILDELEDEYDVDSSQVFATGFSNGGGFTAYLGCRMPDTFAAIAPVGAAYYETVQADCEDTPLATLDIHGTYDQVVDYYGGNRHGTDYESVPEVLAEIAERNDCQGSSIIRRSTAVVEQRWLDCDQPLEHLRLGGGEHIWPSIATEEVREFFGV
ncbi:alpha/beta hydrolase family esterase [Corynebacterium alimapuense]|uniref:Feruloyl esterase n=1 Tax=Corynebacterium alimapuense TaxID=1576874 RepID=A0A3M8K7A1_9CORY|nr:PHB depolymerase family esterase [Corynebacterium alimapuense]RNE49101.1 feruloyl esterase [Corynebacterium alimapuense]